MAAKRARRGGGGGSSGALWIAALIVVAGGIGTFGYHLYRTHAAHVTDPRTGCLRDRAAPQAALFLVDTTDRLSPETAQYVVDTITREEDGLGRYSRVLLVPFGEDVATPLSAIKSTCLPGKGADAGLDENARFLQQARDEFNRQLQGLRDRLTALPPSKSSPIAEQVVRAASDPGLGWTGEKRRLVLLTDGLESSIYWTRTLKLDDPPSDLLRDVDVEYVELGNAKAGRLQTHDLREGWKRWFDKAGAHVRMVAPGYAATPDL